MKKLITSIFVLCGISAFSAQCDFITARLNCTGNLKPEKEFVIGHYNNETGKVSAVLNLEKLGAKEVPAAFLSAVYRPINADEKKLCPSLTISYEGKPIGAMASWIKRSASNIDITTIYNNAVKNNKKEIVFQISLAGKPENQNPLYLEYVTFKAPTKVGYDLRKAMRPLWKSGVMTDEPFFFTSSPNGELPNSKLLFVPEKILSVKKVTNTETIEYKEGKDYIIEGEKIVIPQGSKIEVFPHENMYVTDAELAKKLDYKMRFHPIKGWGLFREGQFFNQKVVKVTYSHSGKNWNFEKYGKAPEKALLPKTIAKLESKQPVVISLFGDSISQGANASAGDLHFPFLPKWADLITKALQKNYGYDDITMLNRALGGTSIHWGVKHAADNVAPDKPDLAILAFGMNDGTTSAKKRAEMLEKIMADYRAQNPDVEFIIVTQFMANKKWMNPEVHDTYVASDKKMEKVGVAAADVRSLHKYLLETKNYTDMSGNNVNHPNDFLVRVYAQVIASKLMKL